MNSTSEDDNTAFILETSRFWFQKVLVPIMVCVGVSGNTITVMILTRRRMRSSTNIYLSALGIADIIYLLFVFLLSFKHYENIHDKKYDLYWRFYGISHWLCDAASSTSVWLTVSFTIERYIAVCHPMKRNYFCTENRAKTVTTIVYIFCIITTASTAFEFQLTTKNVTSISSCRNCSFSTNFTTNSAHFLPKNTYAATQQNHYDVQAILNDPKNLKILNEKLMNCTNNHHAHIIYIYPKFANNNNSSISQLVMLNNDEDDVESLMMQKSSEENYLLLNNNSSESITKNNNNNNNNGNNSSAITSCCIQKIVLDVEPTNFGKSLRYRTFISWYSAIVFGILPLLLIATFNCFLISAVYVSQRKRRLMTTISSNTQNLQGDNSSISNENRITIMLIAVVIMFLICQTPTATFLIYENFYHFTNKREENIYNILGNVFNSLLAVNASCNFIFYSLMSKKFRNTFREIFLERRKKRRDTLQLSSLRSNTNSQKFNPYYHGIGRNASEYRTPRNLETTSLTSVPRSKSLIVRPLGKAQSSDLVV